MSNYSDAIKAAVEKHVTKAEPVKPEPVVEENTQVLGDGKEETVVEATATETQTDDKVETTVDTTLEDVKLTKQVIQEKKRLTQKQMEFAKERDAYKAEKEAFEKERQAFLDEKAKYEDNPFQYAVEKGYDPKELIAKYKDPTLTIKPEEPVETITREEAEKLAEAKAQEALTKAEQAKVQEAQYNDLVDNHIVPQLTSGDYPKLEGFANEIGKQEFLKQLEQGAEIVIQNKIKSGEIDPEDLKTKGKELLPGILKDTLKSFEVLLSKDNSKEKEAKAWIKPKAPATPPVAPKEEPKKGTGGMGLSSGGGSTTPATPEKPRTQQQIIQDAIKKHIK